MDHLGDAAVGEFCWVDLAATDAGSAEHFYRRLFGWTACRQQANGGSFTRLQCAGRDIGSLYQLSSVHLDRGVPSHWTPYVRVDDVDAAASLASAIGGAVIVRPFVVQGVARIALIRDSVGALIGLWQPVEGGADEVARG